MSGKSFVSLAAALGLAATTLPCLAEGSTNAAKEQQLIETLQSNAGPEAKAIACKQLAIYGGDKAVPVLSQLLANPELTSWARIGLQAIPGEAADQAFRAQLDKLSGRPLVGVINSIGQRRDPGALEPLTKKLNSSDTNVACAAAVAIGQIGGEKASAILQQALKDASLFVRPAVGEGCIRCGERLLTAGKSAQALKLYETVSKATLPKQRLLEATRGMILARGNDGIPLLLEQLKATDKDFFGIGLRTARELPGTKATEAIAQEMNQASPGRQPLLLLALADRGDKTALPMVLKAAGPGPGNLRLTAIKVLERLGNVSTVPILLQAAVDSDASLASAGKAALVRLPGNDVDADLSARLDKASGSQRAALIDVAGQRQIASALPAVMKSVRDTDPAVRQAAVQTAGILGGKSEVTQLVNLIASPSAKGMEGQLEAALLSVSGRVGAGASSSLKPLLSSPEASVRIAGIHALAAAGGSDALSQLRGALNDREEPVRDEAVRTLSSWPNTWPEDSEVAGPLLDLAKSAQKPSHQVLAIRGYLQYVQGDKKLDPKAKLRCVSEILPLLKRPEEKRLAIAVLSGTPAPGMLPVLTEVAADSSVAEEAYAALVTDTVLKNQALPKEELRAALRQAVEKSSQDATRKKAEQALQKL